MDLKYIFLGPKFVSDVLMAYEAWEGRETVPTKFKELMMVLEIELSKLYKEARPQIVETRRVPVSRDTKLK